MVAYVEEALFWEDRWMCNELLEELAPNLLVMLPKRIFRYRTIKGALGGAWLADNGPDQGTPIL